MREEKNFVIFSIFKKRFGGRINTRFSVTPLLEDEHKKERN